MTQAEFAKQYPDTTTVKALALKDGTAKQSADSYFGSGDSQAEISNARAMTRLSRPSVAPVANFDPKDTNISAGYNQLAAAKQNEQIRAGVGLQAQNLENIRNAKLANFQKDIYMDRRIKEINPTADIDNAILDIRRKALFDQSTMYDEVKNLPYALQNAAIDQRMNSYGKQLDELSTMRESRINAAKNKVNEEVGSYEGRIAASKARSEGLKTSIEMMKNIGANEVDLAQMRIDHAREMDKLNKERTRGAASGLLATKEEMILNMYIEQHRANNGGQEPDATTLAQYTQQAKFDAKNDPAVANDAMASKGHYSQPTSRGGQVLRSPFGIGSLPETGPSFNGQTKSALEMRKLYKEATK